MIFQRLVGPLKVARLSCSLQFDRLYSFTMSPICLFSIAISGSEGFVFLLLSRISAILEASEGKPGRILGIRPIGMNFCLALSSMPRKALSPLCTDDGSGSCLKSCSVYSVNFDQSAFLKFIYVFFLVLTLSTEQSKEIVMGRWSDPSESLTSQELEWMRELLTNVMSGEDWQSVEILVGESSLITARSESSSKSAISSPRESHPRAENQSEWCALKSPAIMQSFWFKICWISGLYPGRQLLTGGM